MHPHNPKSQAAGSRTDVQPGGTKPRAATTKVAQKVTAGTEHGSKQEGVLARRFTGEPDPNPKTEQEPLGAGAFLSKSARDREPPVSGGRYPTFRGRRIHTIPPKDTKETTKRKPQTQGGQDQDKGQGTRESRVVTGRSPGTPRIRPSGRRLWVI